MERKRRFFMVWRPPPDLLVTQAGQADERMAIEFEMSATLAQALEGRETTSQIVEHSMRVAHLVSALGDLLDLSEREAERLRRAAQLHEIGMIGIPADLLIRRSRLSRDELSRVRSQARLGAEIVRATHDRSTASIIERQYEDYLELRRITRDSRELLLTGILRVADVYDAMTTPRPYQEPLPPERWREVLQLGSGSKFHPAAVVALFRFADRRTH